MVIMIAPIYQMKFASKYNVLYHSVSSDPTELQSMVLSIRKDSITTSESTDRSFSHVK